MARTTRTFSDLDLNFTKHPVTNDVSVRFDENAIKQSVKNLIFTNHYEKPFHPEIGSEVRALLFEPFSPMLSHTLKQAIINTISNYEPRVRLYDVEVLASPDTNSIYVTLEFVIVNTTRPITLNLVLERTR
jgi:phage baseplate assembly protein W